MATHSSVLAWRIPGMGEPGGLPSMGSHRVGHDWNDLADSILKSKDITLSTKVHLVKAMVFPVIMYGCESLWRKPSTEELMLLNCGVGETLESPLDCKEIQPVYPKGNQSWIYIGRTDAEAETTILWPPDAKNWFFGKTLMLGKIEGGRRRGRQRMR